MADSTETLPPTKVAVKAKMKIDRKPADIVANFGDGFTLFLTERARLGTPLSFCQWAKKSFQADIPLVDDDFVLPAEADKQEEAVKAQLEKLGIPPALQQTLARLLLVDIWLDALVVDTKNSAFMFGMTLDFKAKQATGWELLPNCELEEFQLLVTRAQEDYVWPERPQLPAVPLPEGDASPPKNGTPSSVTEPSEPLNPSVYAEETPESPPATDVTAGADAAERSPQRQPKNRGGG